MMKVASLALFGRLVLSAFGLALITLSAPAQHAQARNTICPDSNAAIISSGWDEMKHKNFGPIRDRWFSCLNGDKGTIIATQASNYERYFAVDSEDKKSTPEFYDMCDAVADFCH